VAAVPWWLVLIVRRESDLTVGVWYGDDALFVRGERFSRKGS
jgi:hypothetical protein